MIRNIARSFLFASLALAPLAEQVRATPVGMDTSPFGARGNAGIQFAVWDSFTQTQVNPPGGTTYTFNGVASGASTLGSLSLTQSSAHALNVQGSGLLLPTGGPVSDVYYSSTSRQDWTLNATPSIDVGVMSFQIKTANVNETVLAQLYTPTLNGVGAGTFYVGAPVDEASLFGGLPSYVIEYRWSDLDIDAGTPLTVQFSMTGGPSGNFTRKPVDFVALDVATIPEPGSMTLLGLGAVILYGVRRRSRGGCP